jgi:hypothetical protein
MVGSGGVLRGFWWGNLREGDRLEDRIKLTEDRIHVAIKFGEFLDRLKAY